MYTWRDQKTISPETIAKRQTKEDHCRHQLDLMPVYPTGLTGGIHT